MILLSILAHHSEPGDAELMDWIRHQIDAIVGLDPLAIIIVLGLVIVAMPVVILVAYRLQRARQDGA